MKTDLAIVHCRQVVTLAGPPGPRSGPAMRELAIVEDGGLRVRDGKIVAVGEGGWVEIKWLAGSGIDGRRVVELVC